MGMGAGRSPSGLYEMASCVCVWAVTILWHGTKSRGREARFFALVSNVSYVPCSGCAVGQEYP